MRLLLTSLSFADVEEDTDAVQFKDELATHAARATTFYFNSGRQASVKSQSPIFFKRQTRFTTFKNPADSRDPLCSEGSSQTPKDTGRASLLVCGLG